MNITKTKAGCFKIKGVGLMEDQPKRDFSALLNHPSGPELKCLKTGAEVIFDWFLGRLQALVQDGSTDEPAVLVKFDDLGEITSIKVRADLRSKVETL